MKIMRYECKVDRFSRLEETQFLTMKPKPERRFYVTSFSDQ